MKYMFMVSHPNSLLKNYMSFTHKNPISTIKKQGRVNQYMRLASGFTYPWDQSHLQRRIGVPIILKKKPEKQGHVRCSLTTIPGLTLILCQEGLGTPPISMKCECTQASYPFQLACTQTCTQKHTNQKKKKFAFPHSEFWPIT